MRLPSPPARNRNVDTAFGQRRFWEHTVRDEEDLDAHFDYIHYNPVKHGYVRCPVDWEWSSFHRWVRKGVYSKHWGCGARDPKLNFDRIETTVGEWRVGPVPTGRARDRMAGGNRPYLTPEMA